jgi:hypothetical protein
MSLIENGVNVALVDEAHRENERLVEEISQQREVHEQYGKAAIIPTDIKDLGQMIDSIGKGTEVFGGIEIFIDGTYTPGPFTKDEEFFDILLKYTHKVVEFMSARGKGRILYLLEELNLKNRQKEALKIQRQMKEVAVQCIQKNISINCLAVGPTEEYLLGKYPGISISESIKKIKKEIGGFKNVNPQDVGQIVSFLASPFSSPITGQTLSASGGLNLF